MCCILQCRGWDVLIVVELNSVLIFDEPILDHVSFNHSVCKLGLIPSIKRLRDILIAYNKSITDSNLVYMSLNVRKNKRW